MCFPNDNLAPSCNPHLCSVPSLGCYFLSHIYIGFPCFFWASSVTPVSSGIFAFVTIAAHCCAECCAFRFCLDYWAALHMWLQSYSLTRTSHWQGLGDHLESPCPVLSPQCKILAKWNKMLWVDDHQMIMELECRMKKAERMDLFCLEKRRQRGI